MTSPLYMIHRFFLFLANYIIFYNYYYLLKLYNKGRTVHLDVIISVIILWFQNKNLYSELLTLYTTFNFAILIFNIIYFKYLLKFDKLSTIKYFKIKYIIFKTSIFFSN